MEKHETKLLIQEKKNSEEDKKMKKMEGYMAFLECYKKESEQRNVGYYDMYRNQWNPIDIKVSKYKKKLMNYWEDCVTGVEKRQSLGVHVADLVHVAEVWFDWVYNAGTTYRRMVEPLHIADYYRDGGKNYTTDGKRPRHFILLEEWYKQEQEQEQKHNERKKQKQKEKQKQEEKAEASPMKSKRENMSSSLNDDSCFWAHVEEALILLKNGVLTPDDKRKLKEFENYVWNALKNYAVSPDIFWEKSNFMKWWTAYKEIIAESFYPSLFADFMNCQSYRQYEEGVWCPPDFESNEYRQSGENLKSGKQQIGENLKMRNRKMGENLNMSNQFSSSLEWANLLVNSDLVHQAWGAIEEQKEINPNSELSLYHEIQQSNFTIIAFGTPRGSLQGKEGLISSSTLKEEGFSHFEFLCNDYYSWFSINEAAISIFRSNFDELNLLKNKLVQMSNRTSSIIITGRSVGGCVAALFTLWLLHSFDLFQTRRSLCITFGSPLLGDERLRRCVSKFPTWKSSFLHVSSNQDPIPKLFLSQNPSGTYQPFGTFLLCSASGCSFFEEPDSILDWLVMANFQSSQNQDADVGQQFLDYGKILKDLKLGALCMDNFKLPEWEIDPLGAGIITQLQAVGFPLTQKESHREINRVIERMAIHEELRAPGKNDSNSFKISREMQIYMAKLEGYKKDAKHKKIGYYDMYKMRRNTSDVDVYDYKRKLMIYWESSVLQESYNPHEEGDLFWTSWLMAGTSYRRMIEPLHIAEYYMEVGAKNYIDQRPIHFILLEQWWNERHKPEAIPNTARAKRQIAASRLNEDSCLWARVEEALITCYLLNNKDSNKDDKESLKEKLKVFEGYVYDAIKNNAVSLDIFLEGSSFRQWWNRYEEIMGSSYCSALMMKFWEGMEHVGS